MQNRKMKGFSLIEILLVLAILGIISGIAIPSFLGQRARARAIGDAQANARVFAMALENRKAENGTYGPAATYTWSYSPATNSYTVSANLPSTTTPLLPGFSIQGNSKMSYQVTIMGTGLTYTLSTYDPTVSDADFDTKPLYRANESGAKCDKDGKAI